MRVLHILASRGEGGLEKHTIDLVNNLAKRGVVTALAAHSSLKHKVSPDVHFFSWDCARSRFNPLLHLSLLRIINKFSPTICHAQANKAGKVLSNLQIFIKPIKTLVTIHNIKKRLNFADALDGAIGVSDAVATQLSNKRTYRVYNGTDITLANDMNTRSSDTLLSVGRLVEAKGFDILIKSLSKTNLKLNIVGEGPLRRDLEHLISSLGLSGRVKILGHREDIARLMQQSLAVVISSRREGFSYVFAEALLTKTPVISTDVPVANEVLPRYLLCQTDNIGALSNLLIQLDIDDPAYATLFDFGSSQFTIDAMVSNTYQVYERLLTNSLDIL